MASKIIKVKNLKLSLKDKEISKEATWAILESDILAILNGNSTSKTLEELFLIAEELNKNQNHYVIDYLKILIETDLLQKLYYLLDGADDFLINLKEMWENFCKYIRIIKNIFIWFERTSKNGQFYNIQLLSANLFKNTIILNHTIKKRIFNNLLNYINAEREGSCKSINIYLMKTILSMLTYLECYSEVFGNEYEKISAEFYENEGNIVIKQLTVAKYLQYVEKRIIEEQKRGHNYLNSKTTTMIINILQNKLIKDHIDEILNPGFKTLISERYYMELHLLYNLIGKIYNAYSLLAECFVQYISQEVSNIMNTLNHETIENLINLKNHLDFIIKECFNENRLMIDDTRKTFFKYINVQPNKAPQLLAKYIDAKLRCKDISAEELETCLDDAMAIFRLIQCKDIFEAFYKKDLAKRLLLGKSTSNDAERNMVLKLRYECGSTFTSKIEGMFNDINLSYDINLAFKQHLCKLENVKETGTDLTINVLTSSFWPTYPTFKVNIPIEFLNYQNTFENFFSLNHSGKKLIWQHNLGHCILKSDFNCGKKELQVSLIQTIILLLFNQNDKLTYADIKELINLDEIELRRTLISLSCGKARVLLKSTKGIEINNEDIFVFNKHFTDKLFRIRINQIQLKNTKEEEKEIEKSVLCDRQFQIDAAIVRIMKSYKQISHTNLISELFEKLGIPVKPSDLKKRIELLIEREYMERDKDVPSNYKYIA